MLLAALAVLAACGDVEPTQPSGPSEAVGPPEFVELDVAELPAMGLAMSADDGEAPTTVFIDLDGKELGRVHGFAPTSPGGPDVWLTAADQITAYRLDVARARLVRGIAPVYKVDSADLPDPYQPPEGTPLVGHWAYRLPSPDGRRSLVQWSGECESPTAMLHDGDVLRPVVGEAFESAPESVAMGWIDDSTAVVALWEGLCGRGSEPGTYRIGVDQPDQRTRITQLTYGQMWGQAKEP